MNVIFEFFKYVAENFGATFSVLLLVGILIVYGVYMIIKTFPDIIKSYIEHKLIDHKEMHAKGAVKRKNVSPKIHKILSDLIVNTKSDRSLLFEFSNGTSNLAGLPFIFVSATSESLNYGTSSVSHLYQRLNVSLFAKFIIDLEDNSFYYAKNIEDIRCDYPYIYELLKPNGVKSVLFYSIYGVNDTLGFIVLSTIGDKVMNRKEALPYVAEAAQRVSSLLNLDDLEKTIE